MIVRELWEEYRKNVVHKDAPEIQLLETRRAFYAGFVASFHWLQNLGESVSDEQACEMLEAVDTELKGFVSMIKMGVN